MAEPFDAEKAGLLLDGATAAAGELLDAEEEMSRIEAELFDAAVSADAEAWGRAQAEVVRFQTLYRRLGVMWESATEARRNRDLERLEQITRAIRLTVEGEFRRNTGRGDAQRGA